MTDGRDGEGRIGGRPLRVLHVINCLDAGGAETMLLRLLVATDRRRFESLALSLTDVGEIGRRLREAGLPAEALGLGRRGLPGLGPLGALVGRIRAFRPDVVHCWMYHANLLGGLAALAAGLGGHRPPAIWSIRQTNLDAASVRRRTRLVALAGARLSRLLPVRILFNAARSRDVHVAAGYDARRSQVLANGFDLSAFRPNPAARAAVRAELGVPAGAPLVGLIARFDPQKDHRTFARAAGLVLRARPDTVFLLAGLGADAANATLAGWLAEAGAAPACRLLGHRTDMARLTAALDVACSSSMGEGFANTVGEAMAAAVPCVVTDVGDSAAIVGDTGRVVPPARPDLLAAALLEVLALPPDRLAALGAAARARAAERFSIESVAAAYARLWEEVAARR